MDELSSYFPPSYILHTKKTAFVIEHDFIMATYLADRVIVFGGKPAVAATATP
jgi:ATP-binding cassette, sub-family E, member 1